MVYLYKVIEVLDEECFKERPGLWLIQDNLIDERWKTIGSVSVQKFLKEKDVVDGYRAELVGIIAGHTEKDVTRAFDKGWENGKDWLREHDVTPPGERKCRHCNGEGKVIHDDYMPPSNCKPCKGTGRV